MTAAYGTFELTQTENVTINCGFQPSYIMVTRTDASDRRIVVTYVNGTVRRATAGAYYADTTTTQGHTIGSVNSTGFIFNKSSESVFTGTYMYIAVK